MLCTYLSTTPGVMVYLQSQLAEPPLFQTKLEVLKIGACAMRNSRLFSPLFLLSLSLSYPII